MNEQERAEYISYERSIETRGGVCMSREEFKAVREKVFIDGVKSEHGPVSIVKLK